ncbi:MAG: hypothetical protein AABZ65_07815 [Candidatus Omnitrophota bacterium]
MKPEGLLSPLVQSSLGILIEIAYSLAIILSSIGIIYLVLILKWSSSRI